MPTAVLVCASAMRHERKKPFRVAVANKMREEFGFLRQNRKFVYAGTLLI